MGIHKGFYEKEKINLGTFIRDPIEKFFKKFFSDKNENSPNKIMNESYNIENSTKFDMEECKKNGYLIIGKLGVGKSTFINILCNKELSKVVDRSKSIIIKENNIYYFKLSNGKNISLIEVPDYYEICYYKSEDLSKINNYFNDLLKFIKINNIHLKGIFYLVDFVKERIDSTDIDFLLNIHKIFPLKNLWKKLIIIYTHYYCSPDFETLEEKKNEQIDSNKEKFSNLMEKVKDDSDIIDYDKIKVKYFNNHWPSKNIKQQNQNEQNRKELELLINEFSEKEPLFTKIEFLNIKKPNKTKIKFYDINNNLIKENITFMNIREESSCIIF